MPKFTVLCRVDAYVDYVAQVQARERQQAALLADAEPEAYAGWNGGRSNSTPAAT